jgi:uncharacterized membrane protein
MSAESNPFIEDRRRKWIAAALIGLGAIAYFYAMFRSASAADAKTLTLALTIVAWLGFFAVFAWLARNWLALVLLVAPLPLVFVFYEQLRFLPWLNLLPNTFIYGSLAWLFGRSLVRTTGDEKALITQLATKLHGRALPAPIERYTRTITWVWTIYFVATIVVSFVLFFGVSFAAWSLFSNVYSLPILIGMFVLEYAYRRIAFPWFEHVSFAAGMKAFSQHGQADTQSTPKQSTPKQSAIEQPAQQQPAAQQGQAK